MATTTALCTLEGLFSSTTIQTCSSRVACSNGKASSWNSVALHRQLPKLTGTQLLKRRGCLERSVTRGCDELLEGRRWKRLRMLVCNALLKEESEQTSVQTSTLKEFLEDVKSVGRVRLIVNTGVAVLESVTSFEKLFYHVGPRGEYGNVMSREDNVDFHLLLEKVALARLVRGKSMKGDIPTYTVRFMDINDSVAVSVLVMWKIGTDGEYDPGQVEGFQALLEKYGEEVKFLL